MPVFRLVLACLAPAVTGASQQPAFEVVSSKPHNT